MRLEDLVAAPGLGIRVLHGDDDDLARPLGWIYTTDLPDPSRYPHLRADADDRNDVARR